MSIFKTIAFQVFKGFIFLLGIGLFIMFAWNFGLVALVPQIPKISIINGIQIFGVIYFIKQNLYDFIY